MLRLSYVDVTVTDLDLASASYTEVIGTASRRRSHSGPAGTLRLACRLTVRPAAR